MALMNGVYKLVLCVLRRLLKSDKWAAPIAGFFAGMCCYLDAKDRRKFLMIVLLARLTDTVYSMGESRGLCTRYEYGAVWLWCISNMSQMYCMGFE